MYYYTLCLLFGLCHEQIKGMEEGLHSMRVGGKRRIIIPRELGYTVQGLGPYPANARNRDVLVKVSTRVNIWLFCKYLAYLSRYVSRGCDSPIGGSIIRVLDIVCRHRVFPRWSQRLSLTTP